jgi:hypothetical protein
VTKAAYVDSSCLLAVAFRDAGFETTVQRLREFDVLLTATLTEAEIRAALIRKGSRDDASKLLRGLDWVRADRRLTAYIDRVVNSGIPLRGADVWHLACALFATPDPSLMHFLSLDKRQVEAARRLGFTL